MLSRAKPQITHERLTEVLQYSQEAGEFTWLKCKPQKWYMRGKVAGSIGHQGYVSIRVDGVPYQAHRLAHYYVTGCWPTEDMDHINGVRSDNRWENLRACSRSENMQNVTLQKNNTSGHVGVTWNKDRKKWVAQIHNLGKIKNLGGFKSPEEAASVYLSAKATMHKFQPTLRSA